MTASLDDLNHAAPAAAVALLDGIYEGSPWVCEAALVARPFASVAALKRALAVAVREAPRDRRLALVRAHPPLAGKAALAGAVGTASAGEQQRAGLLSCSAEELAMLRKLNEEYAARFGWPFILAVRGPRGTGLSRAVIIATFARRVAARPDAEFDECLRQIDRIAELRINERFGTRPERGEATWDRAAALARHSDPGFAEAGQLTVTYLTAAHRACSADIAGWMRSTGFDEVEHDAVGNVVGLYLAERGGERGDAPRLLTGSHFDTVRNAGPHDGRLGILVPIATVERLAAAGRRLPFALEVVAFAEEEGQRFAATFIGSRAVVGTFDPAWLELVDADGVSMREAMRRVGLAATHADIAAIAREPRDYLGFVEVHVEQGPVLNALGLPLGVVTSINGAVRHVGEVVGVASHAGTTPMDARRDAATAVAELALHLEERARAVPELVGTMGMLSVPGGSGNVVPGRCTFSLDVRSTSDAVRDACSRDVLERLRDICERRGLAFTIHETMRAAACPSAPAWQARWERAVAGLGLPVHRMPSGAGHDAMQLHTVMPQAMLFVRGENGGISHNPLESTTADDIQLAIEAFDALLEDLAS